MRLLSRRGNDLLPCFPEIAASLGDLPDLVLDGELVVLDDSGRPVFERVSGRARTRRPISVEAAARRDPAVLFAFDILVLRGKDLRKLPLLQRKKIVAQVVEIREALEKITDEKHTNNASLASIIREARKVSTKIPTEAKRPEER